MEISDKQAALWLEYVEELRREPERPFAEQWERWQEIYADRDPILPPPPAWVPEPERLQHANISALMQGLGLDDYHAFRRWTVDARAEFWDRVINRLGIRFSRQPDQVLDLSAGTSRPSWLPGAELNIVSSCFGEEDYDIAVVVGSEGSDEMVAVTYTELDMLVDLVANGLVAADFKPGDAIALYMPMNLECVAAYLGIIRAGCVVVSIADSFAAPEVARRLEIANAAAVITVSSFQRGGRAIELYRSVRDAGDTRAIVIATEDYSEDRLRDGDLLWSDFLDETRGFDTFTTAPDAAINILFSSGTTGNPKAIPWTHLTAIKCAMDGHFHHDIQRGDVVAWPTNIGWMMGPWLIFATLVNRGCIALYEGLPSGRGFAEFVHTAGVTMLGVVPSLVRAWRDSGACDDVDWSRINADNFRYRLRQDPGPTNALGSLKFMFPNKFNVYLHDTPAKDLFDHVERAFSSGCIRLEEPVRLAEYLLRADANWSRASIIATIERGIEQTVRLPEPLPVHLLYCTVWVDDDGTVQFRNDIYGRDAAVMDGLATLPPGPESFAQPPGGQR